MRKLLIVALLALTATPAMARPAGAEKGKVDPNKVICKTSEVIGSRLQTKKTCMTFSQWDQMEREQRMTVERIQAFKPANQ